jgi:hypothetical protein
MFTFALENYAHLSYLCAGTARVKQGILAAIHPCDVQ